MPNLNFLRELIRWYHKNSFNKNYVLSLEAALEEKDRMIANFITEESHKERERIITFCRERDDRRHTLLVCNYIVGKYTICKIEKENTNHGNEFSFYIKSKSDSYIFYGWREFYKCKSDDKSVTLSHHVNYNVYMDSLHNLLEDIAK
jgi:hypothetical protein